MGVRGTRRRTGGMRKYACTLGSNFLPSSQAVLHKHTVDYMDLRELFVRVTPGSNGSVSKRKEGVGHHNFEGLGDNRNLKGGKILEGRKGHVAMKGARVR